MAADRIPPPSKRKTPAFKPPRPSTTTASTSSHKKPSNAKAAPIRRKSAPAKPVPSLPSSRSPSPSPSSSSASECNIASTAVNDAPPLLPHKLLTTLLHHHFERDDTRIAKDASKLVGKYVEVFVKEAIARAGFERQEAGADGEAGFLEMEDLEKLATQLWLDF